MYQRVGNVAFKKNLYNTLSLCSHLGDPQKKFKSVHIAGTNGKGSSAHLLASILQSAGYKTGLYTSPHLKNFTERIKVNGKEIERSEVTQFVKTNESFLEKLKPSFFEMTVAMAFEHFARKEVDFAVIETGLGGRLDSTNIIEPLVSLITNISYDHMDMLGNTLEDIAMEKAGIIKKKVPVIIGERKYPLDNVFIQEASKKESDIYFSGDEVEIRSKGDKLEIDSKTFKIEINPDLKAAYQLKNLSGVIKMVELINEASYGISDHHVKEGLENVVSITNLKGRWQILGEQPFIVCDAAHNAQGLSEVIEELMKMSNKKITFIIGFTREKNVNKLIKLFPKDAKYYFVQANIPRALNVFDLKAIAEEEGIEGVIEEDVNKALSLAKIDSSEDDIIFIGGSIFVIAELNDL